MGAGWRSLSGGRSRETVAESRGRKRDAGYRVDLVAADLSFDLNADRVGFGVEATSFWRGDDGNNERAEAGGRRLLDASGVLGIISGQSQSQS